MKKNLLGILFLLLMVIFAYGQNNNFVKVQNTHKKIDAKAISHLMQIPLSEALSVYGNTVDGYVGKDIEFVLSSGLPEFRIELYNFYEPEQYENNTIIIKEITWEYGWNKKITIWYEKQNNGAYSPKHYAIYSNDMEF